MKSRTFKKADQRDLNIDFKIGLISKIKSKTNNPFTGPVPLTALSKKLKDEVVCFNVAGTAHHIKTPDQIKKLRLKGGIFCEASVVHDWSNKFDPYACAIYVKKIKIGFIPGDLSEDFVKKARKRITYKYYICDLMTYLFEDNFYTGPIVVAIKQRRL